MKKLIASIAVLMGVRGAVLAATLPSALGWYQIPNTKIDSVCAGTNGFSQVLGAEGCKAILSWSGGVLDSTRNRLIVWGGGHGAYYGNELYAINLDTLTIQRLNDPGLPLALSTDSTANGAQPCSRHTYDGIEYMPNVDRLFVFGGSQAGNGYMTRDTWTFGFSNMTWQRMNPSGPIPNARPGILTAYDPSTGKVFLHDNLDLYSYSYNTNSFTKLSSNSQAIGYHMVATIDPKRKLFIVAGPDSEAGGSGRVYSYDISSGSSYIKQTRSTSGGSTLINSSWPGLDYDPVTDRIVAWNGGGTVYSLNLATDQWTTVTYSGDPGAASPTQGRGTHGRWRYLPSSNVFVVVNNTNQDAYVVRLTSGGGPPPPADTSSPTIPSGLTASSTSSSQVNLSWTASTDNVGVSGYRVERCSGPGCTNFSEIATSSVPSSIDVGLSGSNTYAYRVRATDIAGNLSGYSSVASATTQSPSPPPSGGSDFSSRCAAAGVVRCFHFDDATQLGGSYGANYGTTKGSAGSPVIDLSERASGAGSLRIDVPPLTGADAGGSWFGNFSSDLRTQFGENSTFFVQWRQRFNTAMATTFIQAEGGGAQGGVKQVIIGPGDKPGGILFASCEAIHLVVETYYQSIPRFPTVYNSCTGSASHGPYEHMYEKTPTDWKLQNAMPAPGCLYSNAGATGCAYSAANEWMTFKMRVDVGQRSNGEWINSRTRLWVGRQGQPSVLVLDFQPGIPEYWQLTAGTEADDQRFGKIWLLPYMTKKIIVAVSCFDADMV